MTQRIINIGTNPNDGTGDTLRQSFGNTNNNFSDLYSDMANVNALNITIYTNANAAFDKANVANVLAFNTGIGSNAWANAVGVAGNNYTKSVGLASNNYTESIVTPAFDKANIAWNYADSVNTFITLTGPFNDDSEAVLGGVELMHLYYTSDGNVRIRLV